MPQIVISFTVPLNQALQIGDDAYYSTISEVAEFDTSSTNTKLGAIAAISQFNGTNSSITCEIESSTPPPTAGSFIFFKKNNQVNQAKVKGYYADCRFINNNLLEEKAELYCTSAEIFGSSGQPPS